MTELTARLEAAQFRSWCLLERFLEMVRFL